MAAMGRMKSPTFVFLSPPHLPRKQDRLRLHGGEQVHHRRRHGTAHPEVEDRQVLGGRRLHGMVPSQNLDPESLGEHLDIISKVAEK